MVAVLDVKNREQNAKDYVYDGTGNLEPIAR